MPFTFHRLPTIPDVILVKPRVFRDDRGWFAETFKASEFAAHGIPAHFAQDNHSRTLGRGALRGLHFQKAPYAQGKLVRCSRGRILDVAVDIRRSSPTYAQHVAVELSEDDHHILWIPEGFAHAFCALTDDAEVLYKATREYAPAHERCIAWNDPDLAIAWPIQEPLLSPKDAAGVRLRDVDNDFTYAP